MVATIRDWQLHGITLKVELATAGSLIVGGNQTDFPLIPGGEYGAPLGWDAGEYFSVAMLAMKVPTTGLP